MTEQTGARLRQLGRRVAFPAALIAAFALGALLFGGGTDASDKTATAEHAHEGSDKNEVWTCSMHPQIKAGESGQCPICGMDLIPVDNGGGAETTSPEQVTLSESARIRAQIRTTPVKRSHAARVERRLLGRVDYDETRLRKVTSWIGGRIDRLHVRTTGERVKRGQVIATLYSPEVFSAHQDLLVAVKQVRQLKNATAGARAGAQSALEATRDRLRLLGVPTREIATMAKASKPSEQVRIRSPFRGTVIERMATEGTYVTTGTALYKLADLSRLWVQLDAYESDLPLLNVGHEVTLKVEALPTEVFEGRVTFVDPVLNQKTRTTRVRIEVKNTDGKLRPNMFAEAVVRGDAGALGGSSLVIPATAPLFTGRRSVVYVEVPGASSPTYEARVVRLGPKMGSVYSVIGGLSEDERVVIHGAFTLDADLQIRGGRSMMTTADDTGDGPYDQIVPVPDGHKKALGTVVEHYLAIHEALAGDSLTAAGKAGGLLSAAASAIAPKSSAPFGAAWLPLRRQLVSHAKHIANAKSLDDARPGFRDLSQQVATLLRVFGNPTPGAVRLASCPMALGGEGAEWVQRSSAIENPYFGASMHSCGDVHEVVEHGTYLPIKEGPKQPLPSKAPAGDHQH